MSDSKVSVGAAADQRIAEMEERYRVERDKRLRSDGNAQFREMTGELAHFSDDPYANPNFTRNPVHKDVDVLIIGGGLSGIVTGAELRKQGIDNILLLEKAGDFGGTWYWNRYP